jgi:hypothetical protein
VVGCQDSNRTLDRLLDARRRAVRPSWRCEDLNLGSLLYQILSRSYSTCGYPCGRYRGPAASNGDTPR